MKPDLLTQTHDHVVKVITEIAEVNFPKRIIILQSDLSIKDKASGIDKLGNLYARECLEKCTKIQEDLEKDVFSKNPINEDDYKALYYICKVNQTFRASIEYDAREAN